MEGTHSARENIYRQLRAALLFKGPLKLPEHKPKQEQEGDVMDVISLFARVFTDNGGLFYLAHNAFDALDAALRLMEKHNWQKAYSISEFWQDAFGDLERGDIISGQYSSDCDVILSHADIAFAWNGLLGFNTPASAWDCDITANQKPIIWIVPSGRLCTNLGEGLHQARYRYGRKMPASTSLWRPTKRSDIPRIAIVLHQK